MAGYSVVHDLSFDNELKEIAGDLKIGDELTRAVTLVISRNPKIGRKCSENVYFLVNANEQLGRFAVYYTVRDEPHKQVLLLSIKRF